MHKLQENASLKIGLRGHQSIYPDWLVKVFICIQIFQKDGEVIFSNALISTKENQAYKKTGKYGSIKEIKFHKLKKQIYELPNREFKMTNIKMLNEIRTENEMKSGKQCKKKKKLYNRTNKFWSWRVQ